MTHSISLIAPAKLNLNLNVKEKLKNGYLLENWNFLRAFLCPGFLRSTVRESLVNILFFLIIFLVSGDELTNAFEIPCVTAPACPLIPPPLTVHTMSKISFDFVIVKGFSIAN